MAKHYTSTMGFSREVAVVAISIALTLTACGGAWSPTASTSDVASGSEIVHLEAVGSSGTLDVRKRLRASGGLTVHLVGIARESFSRVPECSG